MVRLFLAIRPPADVCSSLKTICYGVRGARWVETENFHLTLRFIGEVFEPIVEDISSELVRVSFDPFDITLHSVGHFESRGRVNALWAGVAESAELQQLKAKIESALRRVGCEPEKRKFKPHVTLARLRNARPVTLQDWLPSNGLFRAGPFEVEEFSLYESRVGGAGSVYIPLRKFLSG